MNSTNDFKNKKITIMGLGLHGGGVVSAQYFAQKGAKVTVTDMKTRSELASSIKKLDGLDITYHLGGHTINDFTDADIVIKNPAVPSNSEYLKAAQCIETDISIFLKNLNDNPIIAVTGSKGKSTLVSAIHHCLYKINPRSKLGGNITINPLGFLDELAPGAPVVLELSSWQLHDLKDKNVLKPEISVITNILNDHLNHYTSMEAYASDKKIIFANQDESQYTILPFEGPWGKKFSEETRSQVYFHCRSPLPWNASGVFIDEGYAILREHGRRQILLQGDHLPVPGEHHRYNMGIAALVLYLHGIPPHYIRKRLATFNGIPHRMEFCGEVNGSLYYNDTTATIPEAMSAGVLSFDKPVHLICGGADKELDYNDSVKAFKRAKSIHLLDGSATGKIIDTLTANGIDYRGPFKSMDDAFESAANESGGSDIVILSPGAASFGMFKNEFERGNKFKEIVSRRKESVL